MQALVILLPIICLTALMVLVLTKLDVCGFSRMVIIQIRMILLDRAITRCSARIQKQVRYGAS